MKRRIYKPYPKTYEDVFTTPGCLSKFSLEILETDYPDGKLAYVEKFNSFFHDFDQKMWLLSLQYYWLQRKFLNKGVRKTKHGRTHMRIDTAYSTFIKHYIGSSYQLLTCSFTFGKIVGYISDFIPKFDKRNPFNNPEEFEFPYKNVSLAHMMLVYQMDERLDLLKEAEEKKMSFYQFLDFVINYINSVNEEEGREVFSLYRPLNEKVSLYYVKYNFRERSKDGIFGATRSIKKDRRKPYQRKKI